MSVLTIIGSRRASAREGTEFPPCCGLVPRVLEWPRRDDAAVACRNPECPNSEEAESCGGGPVFAHRTDIAAKWERFRKHA